VSESDAIDRMGGEFARAFRLHEQGKLREAFLRYDAILKAVPNHAAALHYSGVVLYQSGKHVAAIERIRASIAIDPNVGEAWSNLAIALKDLGHDEAALNGFREAARRSPGDTKILANLAGSLLVAGHSADAETTARQVLALESNNVAAWSILSLALQPQGRMLEALDAASRAASLAPDREQHAVLKAQIETGIGAPEKARQTLEKALARHPMSAILRFELAGLLEFRLAEPEAAAAAYDQVLRIEPQHGAALSQLTFLRARLADWHDRDALVKRYRAGVAADLPSLSPFALLSLPSTRAEQRQCAQAWIKPMMGARTAPPKQTLSSGRLRIGYLSADLHSHATAFLAAGMFEQHDRSRFEVIAYSTGRNDNSPMRARLMGAFDRFVDLAGRNPVVIADAIRQDMVDILIDLKGHTEGATPLVLALRPAPIIVHYLGYPGTLGAGLADYLIGDSIVTPPSHAADYAETLAVIPGSYQVNDRKRPIGETPSRDSLGLPATAFVFCSFNQTYKNNPQVFDAWMTILKAVPDAVLWLLVRTDGDPAIAHLRREAQARGVAPERLVFARHRPNPEYLALYRHADLFLDSWPYNAHTTASDALWAGCPVLTVLGTTFAGRVGASLLTAVGLPELVTANVSDYVATAIRLARDADELRRLKQHLAGPGRSSPLFDTVATTRALEAVYEGMAAQYRQGVRRSFRVEPVASSSQG
jgi:predicted O-linked N-acetylglucosamine transferase (SPINDLY family)